MKKSDLEVLSDLLNACFFDLKEYLDILDEVDATGDLGGRIAMPGKKLVDEGEKKMSCLLSNLERYLGEIHIHATDMPDRPEAFNAVGFAPSDLLVRLASEGKLKQGGFLVIEKNGEGSVSVNSIS